MWGEFAPLKAVKKAKQRQEGQSGAPIFLRRRATSSVIITKQAPNYRAE
jgi:hypothetical protein